MEALVKNCEKCIYFIINSTEYLCESNKLGRCQRYPPQVIFHIVDGKGTVYSMSPLTNMGHWCGEYKSA